MVRLLPPCWIGNALIDSCFNPTMVRLLPYETKVPDFRERDGFNPTMVRLLRKLQEVFAILKARFNPTMVRLLPMPNT